MKLIGKLGDDTIIFDRVSPNKFSATLPTSKTGMYIIQLYAINGNTVSSEIHSLCAIDFKNLTVNMMGSDIGITCSSNNYSTKAIESYSALYNSDDIYSTRIYDHNYYYTSI